MNKSTAMYVRGAFALFLLGLGMYASAESLVAHEMASRGLSTCGVVENPCELAPLTVTASRNGRMVAASPADPAMRVLGTAASAPRAHPVATAES